MSDHRRDFEAGLRAGVVFVALDPRTPGVVVPAEFMVHAPLVLSFSLAYRPLGGGGANDLEVDDQGLHQTLSFSGVDFECRVPWPAVIAVRARDQRYDELARKPGLRLVTEADDDDR